jgi:trimethylamine--corrinoid protein Co-methyltransferase
MSNSRSHHGSSLPYDPLSTADVQGILDAVFQLMREIGVKFGPHPRVLDLFSDAGCDISAESMVKFPTELVKNSLGSVAKNAKIWNRHGTGCIELRTGHTNFVAGITCINVVDIDTGERRPSTREDLARLIRVADALPDIDGMTLPCKMTEKPNVFGEIEEFAVMATNTTKPLAYLCEYPEALESAIEVAVAVRGGSEQLTEKPYFLHGVTALPLHYSKPHLDQILLGADNGIPLFLGTGTIGGASAPVTIAGNLVHSFATDFAGLVLTQLIKEGSFCMGGTAVGFIDPMTGHLGSVAEAALAEAAKCQIARSLGLPIGAGNAGANRGHQFNQEAISIAVSNMMLTVHTRPTIFTAFTSPLSRACGNGSAPVEGNPRRR